MTPTCPCGRPVNGTTLCTHCQHTLDIALANIPAYAADLEHAATGRKAIRYDTGGGTGGTKEPPAPTDNRFLRGGKGDRALHQARNAVTTWARVILTEHPGWPGPRRDTLTSACCWLQAHLKVIAVAPWAGDCLTDLLAAERALYRVDEPPEPRWYAGKCSARDPGDPPDVLCTAELYARAGKATIDCPTCGTRHDVAARRDFLLAEAEEVLVTATEAAGALAVWTDYDGSEAKLTDRIRKWAAPALRPDGSERRPAVLHARGSIERLGRDRALYRLGDVQELLVRHAQSEQARRLRDSA